MPTAIPVLTDVEPRDPNERQFTIMPSAGHLLRIIDIYPPQQGGKRTVMHRTRMLDYVVVIEGEIVLILANGVLPYRRRVQRRVAGNTAEAAGAHALAANRRPVPPAVDMG